MSLGEIANDKRIYTQLNTDPRFKLDKKHDYIIKSDKYASNSTIGGDYFVQDIWGARKVFLNRPKIHYDVGSSVHGFIAHLLAFNQKIILFDIRVQDNKNTNTNFLNANGAGIESIQADCTHLENIADNSLESISALCSVEHFGLGRYGDPIAPNAWADALKAFQRVLKSNGKLYFSVPVGQKDKVCFNAHRVFRPESIIEAVDKMQLLEFSYICDVCETRLVAQYRDEKLHWDENARKSIPEMDKNGCVGLFEFIKK